MRSGTAALFLVFGMLHAQMSNKPASVVDLTKDSSFYPQYQVPVRNIHLLAGGPHEIGPGVGDVVVQVVVSPQGKVIAAKALTGLGAYFAAAERIERARRFEPIQRHGVPVTARFQDRVALMPPERWKAQRVPFPDDVDLSQVTMRMSRGGCYGTCPIYTLTVHGDGLVEYDGAGYVKLKGHSTSRIAPEAVRRLLDLFRAVDFFSTEDEYVAPITDLPSVRLDLTIGQRTKHVTDYLGETQGMPEGITDIIVEMDRVTNVAQWTQPYGQGGRNQKAAR